MRLLGATLPAVVCFFALTQASFGAEFAFNFHFYETSEPFADSDITYVGSTDLTGPATLTYVEGDVGDCAPATITASIAFGSTWVFGPDGGGSSPGCAVLINEVVGLAFYVTSPLSQGSTFTNAAGRVIDHGNGNEVVLYGPGTLTISESQGPGPAPVPEPRSSLLLGSGLCVLVAKRMCVKKHTRKEELS